MDKKEILEKSRTENITGDERQKDIALKGYRFTVFATAILLAVFTLIREYDFSYLIILNCMNLFSGIYSAFRNKRVVDFVLVAVLTFAVAVLTYLHISVSA